MTYRELLEGMENDEHLDSDILFEVDGHLFVVNAIGFAKANVEDEDGNVTEEEIMFLSSQESDDSDDSEISQAISQILNKEL